MAHQTPKLDVESLQTSERHRGKCLDIFLLTSVLFLFVAVTSLAVVGGMVVMRLQSNQEPRLHIIPEGSQRLTGHTPSPAYKMQNVAYLGAESSVLDNGTLKWATIKYGEGTSVGSNFEFNPNQHSLRPKQAGTYFIYISVNVSCSFKCKAGKLRLIVSDKLSCDVDLTANTASVSKKCWTVTRLNGEGLITSTIVPKEGLKDWKLELPGSQFGMFLVD
ncbi:uncharacterized protein LOC133452616 [Cololabis saira]|uniref:uncharacterized protein LOC133452616 n=1 Tax=Cololabis saira TaxID=129043 RepID=UPI002AD34B34|nr:uncharacterized protein LOC133452616 [Cololabis saira]